MIARLRRWWWRKAYRDSHCALCLVKLVPVRCWTRLGPLCEMCAEVENPTIKWMS